MRRFARMLLVVVALLLTGCGTGSSGDVGVEDAPRPQDVDVGWDGGEIRTAPPEEAVESLPPPDLSPELTSGEDAAGDSAPRPACNPGEGCFLDECSQNGQCQSGWCVEHMGEGVCSMSCQDECPAGWTCRQVAGTEPDVVFVCVSAFANLCKPCSNSAGCSDSAGAEDVCVSYGEAGSFCGGLCLATEDCPWGFTCKDVQTVDGIATKQCVADAGICPCTDKSVALARWTPCSQQNAFGTCTGKRVCGPDGLSECDAAVPAEESCNGLDDDCDGPTDEPKAEQGDYINLCDDGNGCTEDNCLGTAGCEHIGLDSGECLDGDACTVADHCELGQCIGNPVLCDDSNPCTDDTCDGAGGCDFADNTAACDDGDPCTVVDECSAGVCAGFEIPCDCTADADCMPLDDGNLCNGSLHCDLESWPYQCTVVPGSAVACEPPPDGPDKVCQKPVCAPDTGKCSFVPDHEGYACDDDDPCTVGDKCTAGSCSAGLPALCLDGNPCTDDSCVPGQGCVFTANADSCDDGNVCTTGDVCLAGTCVAAGTLTCDDGDACNGAETCETKVGCKNGQPLQCDDGNACNGLETCDPVKGCLAGLAPECDDGNDCTDDLCVPGAGCVNSPNAKPCDDGNECTAGDTCKAGVCAFAGPTNCDDGKICTTDACDPALGCLHNLNEVPCDDGDVCTTGDHCHLGTCIASGKLACTDSNPCTDDTCKPGAGCAFTPNSSPCDDQNACTSGETCSNGKCLPGKALACTDSNPCTDDSCDPATGCLYLPAFDSSPCGLLPGETCQDGKCVCQPSCAGKLCGSDGCTGSCGSCQKPSICLEGQCVCKPDCTGKVCGNDGCGGLCGACPAQHACIQGQCVCQPSCVGKKCGDDGCGGSCGTCTGQEACIANQCICQPACAGKECGDDGCGGKCGTCLPMHVCQGTKCVYQSCGTGVTFENGCVWTVAGGDLFTIPNGVNSVTVTIIGGGAGGGSGYYYPGGGGGSGYYLIQKPHAVTPGAAVLVQVGAGGGMGAVGTQSKFDTLTVEGGKPGMPHTGNSGQASAKGGDGGSGGGAGYTNSGDGGGKGSGVSLAGMAGAGGIPSPGPNQNAWRGQGFGAGGGGDSGTSGYDSNCGGTGGSNGGNGVTVGGCGGGGGGAGGLMIPGFPANPSSTQNTAGSSGVVWIKF